MACRNPEVAEKVVLYYELEAPARRAVDEHAAGCAPCARDLAVVNGLVTQMRRAGVRQRAALTHPPEEALIHFAVDPGLLAAEERDGIQNHLEEERCFACRRVVRSIRAMEGEASTRPAPAPVRFWEKYRHAARIPIVAFAALLLVALSIGIYRTVTLHSEVARMKDALSKQGQEIERKDQALRQKEGETQALGQKMETLARENQEQALALDQLRQSAVPKLSSDLFALVGLSTSRATRAETLELPHDKPLIYFYLPLGGHDYPGARWVLKDRQNGIVWRGEGRLDSQTFHQIIAKNLFAPGETYLLEIYGRKGGQDRLLITKKLRLTDGR